MFASIVVGTDGSQTAREAVSQAVELARERHGLADRLVRGLRSVRPHDDRGEHGAAV